MQTNTQRTLTEPLSDNLITLSVTEALEQRRSIRNFSSRALDNDLLNGIVENALNAPSWGNVQPYRVAVASGDLCNQIRAELREKYRLASSLKQSSLVKKVWQGLTAGVLPDGDYKTLLKYPKELGKRYFETGKGLYQALDIAREDRASREQQMARNFCFFDAPTVLFVFCEDSLGPYGPLDSGIFVQSLLLAAQEQGVGTCVQGSVATWASPVRKQFNVPEGYKLICGIAMGYPQESLANSYKPSRRMLSELLLPMRNDS